MDEEKPQALRVRKSWNHARYSAPIWATCFRCTGSCGVNVTDDGAYRDEFVEYRSGDVLDGWTALNPEPVCDPYDPDSHDEEIRRGVNGR